MVSRMTADEAHRFNEIVGAVLRAEAAYARIPIAQLAKRMPIDRSTLTRYLDGTRAIPIPTFYRACEVIGTTPQHVTVEAMTRMAEGQEG